MIYRPGLIRSLAQGARLAKGHCSIRFFGNINVPFQDDLTAANDDDFNLGDFQHYQESPDVVRKRQRLIDLESYTSVPDALEQSDMHRDTLAPVRCDVLQDYVGLKEPVVFVSKVTSPYRNLAIEDHIFNQMPLPERHADPGDHGPNYNRLVFYSNSPCVVIGKNQNPWKEVNLPLLNSLYIPLVRRKSGGGTVVHDNGNVNYSFMTTKAKFDRFRFANLVKDAVNENAHAKFQLEVNDRGDITTVQQPNGVNYKVSGSAYKLAKGKSYHHGTMLLNSRLDVLKQLLHRDENKLGVVDAMSSISSVKSKVTNLEITNDKFIEVVSDAFQREYGETTSTPQAANDDVANGDGEYDQNELFGLTDFIEAGSGQAKTTKVLIVDDDTTLPQEVYQTESELKEWEWKFGATPKFSYELTHESLGFKVKLFVDKRAIVRDLELVFIPGAEALISRVKIEESFTFLKSMIESSEMKFKGSDLAGFVTNDMISDWLGEAIDGTV